jgi:hypothetical protein
LSLPYGQAQTTESITAILDQLETLVTQAKNGRDDPERKRLILSLLSNLESSILRMVDERIVLKPTGQVISTVVQTFSPTFTLISYIRAQVQLNQWEKALEALTLGFEAGEERIPSLRNAVMQGKVALLLSTQGFKETAVSMAPQLPLSPPPDLVFGAPAVIIPLYNLLVREGRVEKEEAARRLLPLGYSQEQRNEFEQAWAMLQAKNYARLEVSKKGKQYLVYARG